MVGDALEEALADIRIVRGRVGLSVMHCRAALWSATVSCARPVVLIVGIADREFTVECVIDSEKPSPNVDLIVVVRAAAKAVLLQLVAVQCRNIGNRKRRQRTPQRLVCGNDVGLPGNRKARGGIKSVAVPNRYTVD